MSQILDGTGNGFRAAVDSFFRLRVFSTNTTQEHHAASVVQEAFNVATALADNNGLTPGAGFNGFVSYVQNLNPSKTMSLQKIVLTSSEVGGIFSLVKNPTVADVLTDNTPVTPANLNFSSGKAAQATSGVWDGVGATGITGITNGDFLDQFVSNGSPIIVPVDGSTILGSGDTLAVHYISPAGATIAASMRAFFESVTA